MFRRLCIFGLIPFGLLLISFLPAAVRGAEAEQSAEAAPEVLKAAGLPTGTYALIGGPAGLFRLHADGRSDTLWTGGEVRKIFRAGDEWFILGDKGIAASKNLADWEERNAGLPVKTIKVYDAGAKSFLRIVQELKDLAADPARPNVMAAATKDTVFLSLDAGRTWRSLGVPVRTNGLKSVAVASLPETTVFVSHGIYGVHYLQVDRAGSKWTELNAGLERLETTKNPDEVSDLAVAPPAPGSDKGAVPEIYAAQTFRGRMYRLDWAAKAFVPIWTDGADFSTVESLHVGDRSVLFLREGEIAELQRPAAAAGAAAAGPAAASEALPRGDLRAWVDLGKSKLGSAPAALALPAEGIHLSELHLLDPTAALEDPRKRAAHGKEGLYLPVNHALDERSLAPYLRTIDERRQNMVVVDMKDDYGRLRFSPRDPAIAAKGRVFNPVDVEKLAATMKAHGVYLVARIVVFKDPELAKKEGGKYAVWDNAKNEAWVGYYETRRKIEAPAAPAQAQGAEQAQGAAPSVATSGTATKEEFETVRTYYDERWVDPYSEEVWEYNAAVSRELIQRGFDEIQFDYIRFPTDGINLGDARYRWRDPGMDMESAMLSFLRHVRHGLDAPISIDIYGANGWYRTGARTGQEVEILAKYVDAICPMYYPSHFEQEFLAQDPAELRPYRIYYRGTLRTDRIARGKVVVRPYVQSFYLNVSYDRKYYNADYVRRQVEGVRDAGGPGLTYWNNVGRYDEIPLPAVLRTAARRDPNRTALD